MRYGTRRGRGAADREAWEAAIDQALGYYQAHDPVRAELLRLRYFAHCTEEETIDALHVGRTTYQKAHMDALSTVAVYAARRGAEV